VPLIWRANYSYHYHILFEKQSTPFGPTGELKEKAPSIWMMPFVISLY
jgi:hypothetical protein